MSGGLAALLLEKLIAESIGTARTRISWGLITFSLEELLILKRL
jgi:hypothetical protein